MRALAAYQPPLSFFFSFLFYFLFVCSAPNGDLLAYLAAAPHSPAMRPRSPSLKHSSRDRRASDGGRISPQGHARGSSGADAVAAAAALRRPDSRHPSGDSSGMHSRAATPQGSTHGVGKQRSRLGLFSSSKFEEDEQGLETALQHDMEVAPESIGALDIASPEKEPHG